MCRITSIRVSVQWVVGLIGRQAIGVSDQYGVRTERFKRQKKIKNVQLIKGSGLEVVSSFLYSVIFYIIFHFLLLILPVILFSSYSSTTLLSILHCFCLLYNNNGNNMKASQIGHWKIVCFLFLGLFLLVVGDKLCLSVSLVCVYYYKLNECNTNLPS